MSRPTTCLWICTVFVNCPILVSLSEAVCISYLTIVHVSFPTDEIYNNAAMTAMQGTLFWMAPEMLHNNKKGYNAKIDIWSLGCVFIEMFAGRRPWEQDDFVSVMFKVGILSFSPLLAVY